MLLTSLASQLVHLTGLVCCVYNQQVYQRQLARLATLGRLRSLHVTRLQHYDQRGCREPLKLKLSALTNLVSLRLAGILPARLTAARGLTELCVSCGNGGSAEALAIQAESQLCKALPELTQLRGLQLVGQGFASFVNLNRAALSGLTRLHLASSSSSGFWPGLALPELAELAALADLQCTDAWQPEHGLAYDLASLTGLTRLQLTESQVPEPLGRWLAALTGLLELHFSLDSTLLRPDDLEGLSALTALTALTVVAQSTPHSLRATLAHAAALTQLRSLSLQVYSLADTQPPRLPELTRLDVSRAGHLAAWLPALATQLPRLRSLAVRACRRQDDAAVRAHLPTCTALQQLHLLCHCKSRSGVRCVDAAGLACLEALPHLAELHLWEKHAPPAPHPRPVFQRLALTNCGLQRLTLHNTCAGTMRRWRRCAAWSA